MEKDPFKEYLRESEPDKAHKGYAWSTAIGLQAVDGLKPSKYLIDTAIQNIEGKITMKEAQSLIDSYYEERPVHLSEDERTEEADKVSSRIAEILSENVTQNGLPSQEVSASPAPLRLHLFDTVESFACCCIFGVCVVIHCDSQ